MEALLIEMRHELDIHLRRLTALHAQIDTLTEIVARRSNHRGASRRGERSRSPMPDSLNRTETPSVNGGEPDDLRLNYHRWPRAGGEHGSL
jgi:hypothetical protein